MCPICKDPRRPQIEAAMLDGMTNQQIAVLFGVTANAVRHHKITCASYTMPVSEFDLEVQRELQKHISESPEAVEALEGFKRPASLQDALKLREADLVAETMKEHMVTFKMLGSKIKGIINDMGDEEGDYKARGKLSKTICELYTQTGAEIRQCAKTLADMQKQKDTSIAEANGAPIIQILGRSTVV